MDNHLQIFYLPEAEEPSDWRGLLNHQFIVSTYFLTTFRPRQNGHRFLDNIVKYIFLNENECISIKISLKFVTKGPINTI